MTGLIKAQIIGMSAMNGKNTVSGDLFSVPSVAELLSAPEYTVFPGFCDVHVHFREPGFSYKEDIKTGSLAAAHGGYTAVCTMPNLSPVPDCRENLDIQLNAIKKDAVIAVYPYAAITKGEKGEILSDMEDIASDCIAFSDDGKGVQSDDMMRNAMLKAKSLGKIIAAHCEVNDLLEGGYIHKGEYAEKHGHKGICSESEYRQIERDLQLVRETGCKYHVCHISAKESVELIRQAKAEGLDVSCETGPHYLVMNDSYLEEDGRFKMNPPLRSEEDRLALLEGIKDGTIDIIATDHAPHSAEEKSKGLAGSAFGIVGLETAFSVMYTHLVRTGEISLEKLAELMAVNPRKRFGIPYDGSFTVWQLNKEYTVDPDTFLSKGRATPFAGKKLSGVCMLTVKDNKIIYKHSDI
ncbi:MAG: dihydroorotase [Ruminococcaceae bacterium]|nr:dihydroorotase [Oscillospiraceae bacterium]MBR3597320.1 dihydroorotase [Clostridia bacterium]